MECPRKIKSNHNETMKKRIGSLNWFDFPYLTNLYTYGANDPKFIPVGHLGKTKSLNNTEKGIRDF